MPVMIRTTDMKYKDSQGNYVGINGVAERTTAEMVADVEAAGADTIANVQQAVAASQAALDGIDAQRNTMIAAIASVAGQGTDTTFTQSGVAADAAEVGKLKSAIEWDNGAFTGIVSEEVELNNTIYYGYYDIATGAKKSGTGYVKIDKTSVFSGWTLRFLIGSNYVFRILYWDHSTGDYLPEKATPWHDEPEGYTFYVGKNEDMAIIMRRKDSVAIPEEEKNAIGGVIKLYSIGTDRGTLEGLSYTTTLDCHYAGTYRSGASYIQSITDMPSDYTGGAFVLEVVRPAFASNYFAYQKLNAIDGSVWTRIIQLQNNGTWIVARDWVKTTTIGLEDKGETIDILSKSTAETIPYSIGSTSAFIRADTGATGSSQNYERTDFVDVSGYDYIIYSRAIITATTTVGGTAFYTAADTSAFISNSGDYCGTGADASHYEDRIIKVPETAQFARFTLPKNVDGFYIKGIKSNPLKGLKLSLLGASIETFTGEIPEGNAVYYTGSNAGVKSVNEMWWKVLCNNTGMIPLVIDAWSGSGVCYNYATDSTHSDTNKIPMCSDLRTGRLGTENDDPDIILMVGGTNDWTYSQSTTTPLGNWNGRTAVSREDVVSGQSTFMESYASMIAKLHENYPNAILVGVSLEFCCRGTSVGLTRVNDMGYTESDYNDAIERVCKIMGVPFIDVYNVGFNYDNYYPTYAQDSSTDTTHPNARGHAVIAKRMIEELPKVVKQFR